jgi:hypothetical protein
LYDDDAAVTTTDPGSDQATHQLDNARRMPDLRELFSSTLPDDRTADGRSVWEIWTPVCDALLEGRAIEISRYELPDWHLESPKHGGNPHDRFVLDADDVLRPAPELPKVTPNRATRRAMGQRGPGLNGQR